MSLLDRGSRAITELLIRYFFVVEIEADPDVPSLGHKRIEKRAQQLAFALQLMPSWLNQVQCALVPTTPKA